MGPCTLADPSPPRHRPNLSRVPVARARGPGRSAEEGEPAVHRGTGGGPASPDAEASGVNLKGSFGIRTFIFNGLRSKRIERT